MKDVIFKKVTRELDLREYTPEMETSIDVWVNQPKERLEEYRAMLVAGEAARGGLESKDPDGVKESAKTLVSVGEQMIRWLAETWSQGTDAERHWSVEDVRKLLAHCNQFDPALWRWVTGETVRMIAEYRNGTKKG